MIYRIEYILARRLLENEYVIFKLTRIECGFSRLNRCAWMASTCVVLIHHCSVAMFSRLSIGGRSASMNTRLSARVARPVQSNRCR